jgi:peptide/nickel transport system ATP-binding protein
MTTELCDAFPANSVVLEGRHLTKYFPLRRRRADTGPRRAIHAVEDVSLSLRAGEIVALIGESGSGKSTFARLLAQLDRPTSGEILLEGTPVVAWRSRALRKYCRSVQYIFQDPFSSLNPVHTIQHQLRRPLQLHGTSGADVSELSKLLGAVALSPAEQYLTKYPHELSGGQRQRIVIARSLAASPKVLLADEPVSMLDVSVRLGILSLLQDLQRERNIAILYITHDMASARYFADRSAVMYAGQIVEAGASDGVVRSPAHPYTRLLLQAAPDPDRKGGQIRARTSANPANLVNPAAGCRFQARCPDVMDRCHNEDPPCFDVGEGQWARCWLHAARPLTAEMGGAASKKLTVLPAVSPGDGRANRGRR